MDRVIPVKRASVSAAVEIFREEVPTNFTANFQERVPSCKQCIRERTKTQEFRNRQKGRRKQNRANTPIVIQLKDTLKAAILQKQRNKKAPLKKQDSGESRDEADVETDNSSDRGDDVNRRRKNAKNLSAFINRMEKAHRKETYVNIKGNLRVDSSHNEKLVAEYVLNNVTASQNLQKVGGKKSFVNCENIDVICNDLNSVESTVEDTEESEISSTTSSSEIQSDSDISNHQDYSPAHEFTTEELQRLAEYTTGCPLVRYDCLPSSCPHCQWYNSTAQIHASYNAHKHSIAQSKSHTANAPTLAHKVGHARKLSKLAQPNNLHVPFSQKCATVEVGENISSSDSDVEDGLSEASMDTDTSVYNCSSPFSKKESFTWQRQPDGSAHVSNVQKQLMDIDIAGKHNKSHFSDLPDLFLDSVYIDLSDTDVTFSVYYHHDLHEIQSCSSCTAFPGYDASGEHNHEHGGEYFPYFTLPFSHQYLYCSIYWPPLYNLPMPFLLQPEDSLPKTAMVPPEELANCKYYASHNKRCKNSGCSI